MTSEPAPNRRPIATVRISTVVLIGIAAAVAVPAAAAAFVMSGDVNEETAQVTVSESGPVTKIVVADGNGSVHITGDPAVRGVTGHATLTWHRIGDSRPVSLNQNFADGVLTLSKGCGSGQCGAADIDIRVPPTTSVQVVTTNAGVEVSNVSGTVNLATTNAEISATRLGAGDAYLKTTNATINASFAGGPKNITAKTTNARVTITTDGSTIYYDDTQTSNGNTNLANLHTRDADNVLTVRTTNGDVTVK